ncbi:MAG: thiamine phosphate synthase [Rhodospirillaceae bacterium]|nr:thiamine phosphate synthase [Rhodospirillaceae bacterium]MBT6085602.1 thiamine phosphate synthase [Rhodospirillaceae bacterium]MBT6885137.1 thiamine phosphate synthase [Rhodospirillaceae bacterium]MBT7511399.1 thiamine phosphate synthase [Rhodospirillaceae bacterium]
MNEIEEADCRLYLISPPQIDPKIFRDDLAAALGAGDVGAFQLRIKGVDDDTIRRTIDILLPVAEAQGTTFILNDRPDLAAETGCDGVHIGQDDAGYKEARACVGPERIVGVTCKNSRHLAMVAGEQGADYVAFGAFFPTQTKQADTQAELETLEWWSEMMVLPCVAIGGITAENCPPLVRAGADFLSVVSAVWNHPEGPARAVEEFNIVIAAASA